MNVVRLTPATGPRPDGPGPREWLVAQLDPRVGPHMARAVIFGCPFCSSIGIIGPPPPVTADGMVISLVSCSSGSCTFSFQVFLEGWADRNRVLHPPFWSGAESVYGPPEGFFRPALDRDVRFQAHPGERVEIPQRSLCQADGSGE